MATMVAPERALASQSLEQRFAALEKANVIRTYRAGLKRDLKAGRIRLVALIADPPAEIETMRVAELLLAAPKFGRVKVNRALRQVGISPSKTLGGMSPRQRGELAEYLR